MNETSHLFLPMQLSMLINELLLASNENQLILRFRDRGAHTGTLSWGFKQFVCGGTQLIYPMFKSCFFKLFVKAPPTPFLFIFYY